jgi:hypothetical protein
MTHKPDPVPLALLVSDLHLQLETPVARNEKSWTKHMAQAFGQLRARARELDVPIICAGDVFDHWKAAPELINFAMDYLPEMHAIPGQHDLPLHNYDDIQRSAYWTLVKAKIIHHLEPGIPTIFPSPGNYPDLFVHAFPWGKEVTPNPSVDRGLHLAVIHSFIWRPQAGYPGASKESKLDNWRTRLKGYDTALFGDNHRPFVGAAGQTIVFNHGTFFLRKSDERSISPHFGVLMSDGDVHLEHQDVQTAWGDMENIKAAEALNSGDIRNLVSQLEELGSTGLDYVDAVAMYVETHEVPKPVKEIIVKIIQNELS